MRIHMHKISSVQLIIELVINKNVSIDYGCFNSHFSSSESMLWIFHSEMNSIKSTRECVFACLPVPFDVAWHGVTKRLSL